MAQTLDDETGAPVGLIGRWQSIPLYLRILGGLIVGVGLGVLLRRVYAGPGTTPAGWVSATIEVLNQTSKLLLRLLTAVAPPLILTAVVRALITAEVKGRLAGRLMFLLALNTLVAIGIGLLVANVIRPGEHGAKLDPAGATVKQTGNPVTLLLNNVPESLLEPLVDSKKVIGVIMIAIAFGIAARRLDAPRRDAVARAAGVAFDLLLTVLHWIIQVVPFAVMAKVAYIIATEGFHPFRSLGWFILAVLVALLLQGTYYLVRVRVFTWVRPSHLLGGTRDALAMAFSTASSTATMPVTYACLRERVGLRQESASLGSLVGSNFNNDGTALYEAMAALFVAQMIGIELNAMQQVLVVLTSVVASVGAAGIPEAGLVTMTLVFNAVGLPVGYIALLLPVDWFLDRCRTVINVMGDTNVSCLLDGRHRDPAAMPEIPVEAEPVGPVS